MSLPELLSATVGDEEVVAEVSLGGSDRLAVTPTRTLIYRGDGLLSDESVEEYGHDAERIELSTGRRKAKITLGYGLDGDETITVPAKRADDVLHPILAGVLSATGVTDPGESVVRTFRFSELTLVVTSGRLVKHVGPPVWNEEFEEFPYADLTDLSFEEGTVATAVVLAHDGRSERFKAPNESARAVRETLVDAVCSYYDVDSLEAFRQTVGDDEADAADDDSTTDFGEGPDPLSASPVADAEAESDDPLIGDSDSIAGDVGSIAGDADPVSDDATRDERETESVGATPESDRREPEPGEPVSGSSGTETSRDAAASGSGGSTNAETDPDPLRADATDPRQSRTEASGTGRPESRGDFDEAGGDLDETGDDRNGARDRLDEAATGDRGAFDGAPDAFDESSFETAGVEGEDLATEVAELRHVVEAQSERLDRQSALIEQLIEELRRGR
ncbi:hypothetical protein GJ633_04900 [Halorubrum sp. CBA1125]|uniref:DUF7115 domain-containing protein n=1 Tax=Halorubrum sp. CBA1125 TaxID=2668072 RepID=UPI0012E7439B|nr:hypothetical protein [Halorubrum sp. CBA1125]MUW14072.1 hypothetical protein [Halorubrum sp. CBA1125]